MNSNYLATVRGLRELHHLTAAGRLDSPEADAVRDATDACWEALTTEEKKTISELSEDLYSITDPSGTEFEEINPEAQSQLSEIYQAQSSGDWSRVLELLRRCAAFLDPPFVSYLRGSSWDRAGDPATAAIFYKHASDSQSENRNYLSLYLYTLNKSDAATAQVEARKILDDPGQFDPAVVVTACNILFDRAKGLREAEAVRFFQEIIPILKATLDRIEKQGDQQGITSIFLMACTLVSFGHEFLQERQAAIAYCSKGLTVDPTNQALLVTRGCLLYGDDSRAIDDFNRAIEQGTTLVWPYYFLAHHAVVTGEFEQCRRYSERGLELEGSTSIKSELAEWLAIAQSRLGFPDEFVRSSFEWSLRLNPSNDEARRNFHAFEAASQPIRSMQYETRTESTVRASGLSERRLNRVA